MSLPKWDALPLLVLAAAIAHVNAVAQAPTASIVQTSADEVAVLYSSTPSAYYSLERSTELASEFEVQSLALGEEGVGEFRISTSPSAASFFRIRQMLIPSAVERIARLDLFDHDGDGIDDVWELANGLDPLDPSDAASTVPGDARTWLQVYQDELPFISWFPISSSEYVEAPVPIGIPVRFNRPFQGTLKFQVGGTAVEGRDYQAGFSKPVGERFTGTVQVSGDSAMIPLSLLANDTIDRNRSIVLSIHQLVAPDSYRVEGMSTHVITITEGDHGVYSGVMTFADTPLLGSQRLKFAVRSTTPGRGIARFDAGSSLLFRDSFELPCLMHHDGAFEFEAGAVAHGELRGSSVLGRSVSWDLTAVSSTPPDSETGFPGSASFTLQWDGLAAGTTVSGILAQLVYMRID